MSDIFQIMLWRDIIKPVIMTDWFNILSNRYNEGIHAVIIEY